MKPNRPMLRIENEPEMEIFLENFFSLNDGPLYRSVKTEEILDLIGHTGLNFVLCELEFQPISKEAYLKRAGNGSAHSVHRYSGGYLNIKFDHDARNRKDSTLYLSKSWDLSIFDDSMKEKIKNSKGGE